MVAAAYSGSTGFLSIQHACESEGARRNNDNVTEINMKLGKIREIALETAQVKHKRASYTLRSEPS